MTVPPAGPDAAAMIASAYAGLAAADDAAIVISVVPEAEAQARAERLAARPDAARLPLLGVPFMVKDNIDVAGLPTTAGCPSYAYQPTRSARVVERLEAAGAVVIAKTNMDQFATGLVGTRSPYGTPRHPLSPDLVPGGSSSGSAVAVARGIVPFALGTDTAGSGRVPAAFCGIVGLKPTRGWLSMSGVVPAVRSLDCMSIFAGSVTEAWKIGAIAAGFDVADPFSRRSPLLVPRPAGPLRVGTAAGVGHLPLDPAVTKLIEVDIDDFIAAGTLLYGGPWVAERYAAVGDFLAGHDDVDPVVASIIAAGARWTAVDAARAGEHLAGLRRKTEEVWTDVDVLVLPTTPFHPTLGQVAADPLTVNDALGRFTNFVNLLDLCAIALPPNLSVVAPAWHDGAAAAVAAELAGETWRPPMASSNEIELAVVGAHLRGQPLHAQLEALGARFVAATTTAPAYRLYALAATTPPKPGMTRVRAGGAAITVEVYALAPAAFGALVASVADPLCIGSVELADGTRVHGFLCENAGLDGATDITRFGGWQRYLASNPLFSS